MKSMVYDEKRRLGIGSGCSKPGGFDVESLVRAQTGHAATKCAQSRRKRFHHTRWNSNSDSLRAPRCPAISVSCNSYIRISRKPPYFGTTNCSC